MSPQIHPKFIQQISLTSFCKLAGPNVATLAGRGGGWRCTWCRCQPVIHHVLPDARRVGFEGEQRELGHTTRYCWDPPCYCQAEGITAGFLYRAGAEIPLNWVDVSDIFHFFPLGGGKGESVAPGKGRGSVPLLKIPGGGGVSHERGGCEGPGGCLRGIRGILGGGGQNIFSGAEMPTK